MEFLNFQEIGKLQEILINKTLLQSADFNSRSDLLTNCGLGKYSGLIPLDKPLFQFVNSLCAKLSGIYTTVDGSQRLGLVVFLEYISYIDPGLSSEDKDFILHVISKWERSQASGNQKQQPEQSPFSPFQAPPSKEIKIFFSYSRSHKDKKMLDSLEKSISGLKKQGIIKCWYYDQIGLGRDEHSEITRNIDSSQIILLLISRDFMNWYDKDDFEVNRAMERAKSGKACVIPILLRMVDWSGMPFSNLPPLPKEREFIDNSKFWTQNKALLSIAQDIRLKVEQISANFS